MTVGVRILLGEDSPRPPGFAFHHIPGPTCARAETGRGDDAVALFDEHIRMSPSWTCGCPAHRFDPWTASQTPPRGRILVLTTTKVARTCTGRCSRALAYLIKDTGKEE